MRVRILPTFPRRGAFTYRTTLDGEPLRLQFSWGPKTRSWYLDLYDGQDNPLVLGKRVTNGGAPLSGIGLDLGRRGVILFVGPDAEKQSDLSKLEILAVDQVI